MLILVYNRMFNQRLRPELFKLSENVELTEDRRRLKEADAVVFHLPTLRRLFMPAKPAGQAWVAWYMECEQHYRRMRDERFMSQFELKLCYRQDADLMVSYIPHSLQIGHPPPLPQVQHQHLMCSFISGRVDRSGRGTYLKELARHVEIHQYGKRGNRTIPNDRGRTSKFELLSRYRFSFAFENAIAPDYVTEKFYDPLLAGSVPVYLGAPNIAEFAPVEDCYIHAADFSGPSELAAYLTQLNQDEAAYARLLNWRDRPINESFKKLCRKMNQPGLEQLIRQVSGRQQGRR